ncbi:unnamed protein product [Bursaphelenchus xylophilus]|uniref:(pine wood nematode) hypothetical protein n=1 Tax=Bursaphelenchus xylophilus TaxID=6326 RepID=A0A1I7SAI4_BURXY|nr:unnamed protein product [Bursaphelenchus xylophilus]CAG9079380.1 unnamed protein product [Bursaphelenchus xylophilus]
MCVFEKVDSEGPNAGCFEEFPQRQFVRFQRRMRVSDSTELRKKVLKQVQEDANDEAYLLELLNQSSNSSKKPSAKRKAQAEYGASSKKRRQG